jgi:hypothetical protein
METNLLNRWTCQIKGENIETDFNKFILDASKDSFKILITSNFMLLVWTMTQYGQLNFFLTVQIASLFSLVLLLTLVLNRRLDFMFFALTSHYLIFTLGEIIAFWYEFTCV